MCTKGETGERKKKYARGGGGKKNIVLRGGAKTTMANTVEPRFNDLQYNNIPGTMTNIHLPSKSYSKLHGEKPRYSNLRYNDISGLTMGMSLAERKIF